MGRLGQSCHLGRKSKVAPEGMSSYEDKNRGMLDQRVLLDPQGRAMPRANVETSWFAYRIPKGGETLVSLLQRQCLSGQSI